MLNRDDRLVQFKLEQLGRALPATSTVVFGDVWGVDGGYTLECADRGCERVLLVDSLETPAWQRERLLRPAIDFRKGDFSDPFFMASVEGGFEVGVVFDILLHQPALLGTLTLMLSKVEGRFCVVQPMLEEADTPGTVVYLPGNPQTELYPLATSDQDVRAFDVEEVNHSHWIWGMTPSFLTAAMRGEGFELVAEEVLEPLPNPSWRWWGAVYERRGRPRASHWANHTTTAGLWTEPWAWQQQPQQEETPTGGRLRGRLKRLRGGSGPS